MEIRLPLFIVFEGIDGSGKSTLAKMVHAHFSHHLPSILLSEPTESEWGRKIRALIKNPGGAESNELLELFIQDRSDDVRRNIAPALEKGSLVIMDRYMHSNAAYQGFGGISPHDIIAMNIARGFPKPERIYLIDIDEGTALERAAKRNNDLECFEKLETLKSIRKNYLALIDSTFLVLDGAKSPDFLAQIVIDDIYQRFKDK